MDIGWESWASLVLGVAGLIVGVGSWVWAFQAKESASKAEKAATSIDQSLDAFKQEVSERIERERVLRETAPAPVKPANFQLDLMPEPESDFRLLNNGPGTAYNIEVENGGLGTFVDGTTHIGELAKGESRRIGIRFDPGLDMAAIVRISWEIDSTEKRVVRIFPVPDARSLY